MNLANNLTLLRILLVPVFVGLLTYYSPGREYLLTLSLALFIFACLTDALDGYLARRLRQMTVLGSYIDPLADKLLLLSGFLCLSFMDHLPLSMRIPAWVTIPVITRDVIILIGAMIIFITTGKLKAQPLFIGKATTVLQMTTLLASLCSAPYPLQLFLFIFTVALTAFCGLQYLRAGSAMLK